MSTAPQKPEDVPATPPVTFNSDQLFRSAPANVRSSGSQAKLFAKGKVNGAELIAEMRAVRTAAASARTQTAFNSLMGAVKQTSLDLNSADGFDWDGIWQRFLGAGLKELRTSISYAALDYFMETMIDDKAALEKEWIDLPSAEGMSASQRQRVLNMAALTVGARVANRVANEAEQILDNLEGEYKLILEEREAIARLMADVVEARRQAQAARDEAKVRQMTEELRRWLSAEDIAFIDSFGADRPIHEFANDFALQNVAIAFLQRRDPEKYQTYKARVTRVVGLTRANVKTMGSALSFGGLVASFINETSQFGEDGNVSTLLRLMPLGAQFFSASAPLAAKTLKTAATGVKVETSSLFGEPRFRLVKNQGDAHDVKAADAVFNDLATAGELDRFKGALFASGSRGLLMNVYQCDAETTGRMLDSAVPDAMRNQFGEEFMKNSKGTDFHFVNALTNKKTPGYSRMVSNVLARDQRKRSTSLIVGDLQQQVASNMTTWSDSQLTRIILANHVGSASHAQMQVGEVIVRLIPSMTAVYEYETYVDSCRSTARQS